MMRDDLAARATAAAREARDRGATREQIESIVAQIMASEPPAPTLPQMPVRPDASRVQPSPDAAGDREAMGQMFSAAAATPMQVLPGAEAVQAGVRSLVRRQPYREAHRDIRASKLPAAMALPMQAPVIGGMAGKATGAAGRVLSNLTRTPARTGATFGAASGALDANPDLTPEQRGVRTVAGGAIGGTIGKVADVGGLLARAWIPGIRPRGTPDEIANRMKDELDQVAGVLYNRAAQEAAASPARSHVIQNLLNRPSLKPYSDAVRGSEQFANADDPTVLREVYRQLSDAERTLRRSLKSDPAKVNEITRTLTDVRNAKREVTRVTDVIMPTFRRANAVYAAGMRKIEAVGDGVAASMRTFGQTPSGRGTLTKGRAAIERRFSRMPPEERAAAVQGFLAETRNRTNPVLNLNVWRSLTGPVRAARATTFLRNAGDEGQLFSDYLVKSGIIGGTGQR